MNGLNLFGRFAAWFSRTPNAQVSDSTVGGDVIGGDKIINGLEPREVEHVILEMDQRHAADRAKLPLYRPAFSRNNRDFESLSFKNSAISFRGRTDQFKNVRGFLDAPNPFMWWMVTGSGGVGKSKFALELCLRIHGERHNRTWVAGFLDARNADRLEGWQANHDTLIVIDYVLRHPDKVRDGLLSLTRQCRSGSRVRVLLLERSFDENARARILSSNRGELEDHAVWYNEAPLHLGPLSDEDIWETVTPFLSSETASPDRSTFFNRLATIDPERRMLVALILAVTYHTEDSAASKDLSTLMRAFVLHERTNHWPSDPAIRPDVEEPLIALATIAGGLRLGQVRTLPDEVKRLVDQLDPERNACRLVTSADEPDLLCGPLTPDLLGEIFALDIANKRSIGTETVVFPWLVETAWRLNANSTFEFEFRCARDFPLHRGRQAFLAPVAGVALAHVLKMVRRAEAEQTTLASVLLAHRDLARSDLSVATAVTLLGAEIISSPNLPGLALNAGERLNVLYLMALLAKAHVQERSLRAAWADAVVGIIALSGNGDAGQAQALIGSVAKEMQSYPEDAHLRRAWSAAVNNFVVNFAAKEPQQAHQLIKDVKALALAHSGEGKLREMWIRAVENFVDRTVGQDKLEAARGLLSKAFESLRLRSRSGLGQRDKLREEDLAYELLQDVTEEIRAHSEEERSRQIWARTVANFVQGAAAEQPDRARHLIDAVATEMRLYPDEAGLREQWGWAVTNFVARTAAQDRGSANKLVDAIAAEMRAHPENSDLREKWASAVTNFVGGTAAQNPENAVELIKAVATEMRHHREEPALREQWASAVVNFVGRASKRDQAHEFLEELAEEMHDHPGESVLRKLWAHAVANFIGSANITSGSVAEREYSWTDDLVQETTNEMRSHPEDSALRAEWAHVVANCFSRHARRDLDYFRALIELLKAETRSHPDEPELCKQGAMAMARFFEIVADRDPDAADSFIDAVFAEMRTHPNEPALREQCASVVMVFIHNLPLGIGAAADRDRAYHLIQEVTKEMRAHPDEAALRAQWARAAALFASRVAAHHPDWSQTFAALIEAELRAHPNEQVLWEAFEMSQMPLAISKAAERIFGLPPLTEGSEKPPGARKRKRTRRSSR